MKAMLSLFLLAACLLALPARAEMQPGDDGLYHPAWFQNSFLDLRDDLADAAKAGKHLAVVWEQKGCSYCKRMHTEYLSDPKLAEWIAARFVVVQLDLHGSRMVTDFDGQAMTESDFARKHGVRLTPTIQFLHQDPKAVLGHKDSEAEATRMPGLLERADFEGMFRYVADTDGQGQSYLGYMKAAAGK